MIESPFDQVQYYFYMYISNEIGLMFTMISLTGRGGGLISKANEESV